MLQDDELTMHIASHLSKLAERLPIQLVFKASFDKANRTSIQSYRGPGLEDGLKSLEQVAKSCAITITTGYPRTSAGGGGRGRFVTCCKFPPSGQTDGSLVAAAKTGRAVNVKKGQFMAPWDMRHVVRKLSESGCENILLCERGTFFGYSQLVSDFRSLIQMRAMTYRLSLTQRTVFSSQVAWEKRRGGNREMVAPLARAATAVGIDGLFSRRTRIRIHPQVMVPTWFLWMS